MCLQQSGRYRRLVEVKTHMLISKFKGDYSCTCCSQKEVVLVKVQVRVVFNSDTVSSGVSGHEDIVYSPK